MSSSNFSENATFPYPPQGKVGQWWAQMVAFSLFNVLFFCYTFYKTRSNLWIPPNPKHYWSYRYCFWMRLLPIPFVIQTTWRSFLPSLYNSRQTIIDDSVNSVIIARFGAFVGEICWGIQIGWALRVISLNIPLRGSEAAQRRLRKAIPIISLFIPLFAILGNICSVVGMVTANYVFVVIEETLWACIFFFGGCSALCLWHYGCDSWSFDYGSNCFGWDINPFDDPNKEEPYDPPSVWVMRMFIRGFALFGLAATPFMVAVDIPKWYNRLRNDELNGVTYFDTVEGFNDAASERRPTQLAEDWDQDMFWMSAYFSGAVLASIFLMYAPGRIVPEMVGNNGQTGVTPIEDNS